MVRRVGSPKSCKVNVRVIAAMNIHPGDALEKRKIRTDLFYRLNVLTFGLLPLRERVEDIEFLSMHFIKQFNRAFNKNVKGSDNEVNQFFKGYSWP
jgi:arginine utilization regulatory protein